MSSIKPQNIAWIDHLRILACFLVILSHSCDSFIAQFDTNHTSFLWGTFVGSLVRPCVPLFTMMTAVLLLPIGEQYTMRSFYRKRIGRLVWPLVFWSIALPLMAFAYFALINPNFTTPQISEPYTVSQLVHRLTTFVLNFNFDTVPLWYLYLLIGLYLVMPILNTWLRQADRKDIRLVIYLWMASTVLPYLQIVAPMLGYEGNFGNMGLLGVCDWNAYGSFYYLSGFIGYLVLGYYFKTYPIQCSWGKLLSWAIPSFLVGYAITSGGYIAMQEYYPGQYAYLEIMWLFSGMNVAMMTIPVFLIVQKLGGKSRPWVSKIASYTFGIYLCHYTFIYIFYDVYNIPSWPYIVRIACLALSTFIVVMSIVKLLSTWRVTRRFVS